MLRTSELKGYAVEGLTEKLIATLYADDTTVYLAESDSYTRLNQILRRWCLASGARFNIAKTELIPFGTEEYRTKLHETRRLNDDDEIIQQGIRIARDGEPTRILGTWPGNRVYTANAWSVMLDKIQGSLDRWDRKSPTLNGRSIISQVVAGGYSQYLTAAQGMPSGIEQRLDKLVLNFLWSCNSRHPINMETLRQ
ncbi:hypothetical protein AURDEDRAFT_36728, partial [Auricularia subglabra TFB-10046 SS5]